MSFIIIWKALGISKMNIIKFLFYLNIFIIFWAMIGYPVSLKILSLLYKKRVMIKNYDYYPTVTVMVVAHNEEKVILDKLNNIIDIEYPKDKIEFLIASDHSTDRTNQIVSNFIQENKDISIRLYEVKERKGKTNAQNEAHKMVNTEFLVMTDANSIFEKNAVTELISSFNSEDIAYVTGKLVITNKDDKEVSNLEASYWGIDLFAREIESRIQTITAGNGAIYACRTKDYYDFKPIECHDSEMPIYFALQKKRVLYNKDAIAYEKAGEVIEDEYKRKVRMNRRIVKHILPDIRILNIIKYKWFSYFYFGHRTCRYLLWISHLIVLLCNIVLVKYNWIYLCFLFLQLAFYLLAYIALLLHLENSKINIISYYCMTIIAQWNGVFNILTGRAAPFWEKAETTR